MKIPQPGEAYEKWDGEIVMVSGLVLDEEGAISVEYDNADGESVFMPLSEWLGVVMEAEFPFPRRFMILDEERDNRTVERDSRMDAIDNALKKSKQYEAPIPIGSKENGGDKG